MTNGFPDLKAMLDGRNVFSVGHPSVDSFGVLESSAVHIKVVKY
jgi:hypothetical protein